MFDFQASYFSIHPMMNQEAVKSFVQLFTLADTAATERVSQRLILALRDPAGYQRQFAEELAERGITAELPKQELHDLALIDALLGEDLVWESDWHDTAPAIAEGINDILERQNRAKRLKPTALISRREPGPEQLDAVQDALELLDLALVLFTLDSDSYPLGVVADAQADEARHLAKELGFGITVY